MPTHEAAQSVRRTIFDNRAAPRGGWRGRARIAAGMALLLALFVAATTMRGASAATGENPYQRGPDPTAASVAADRGTFATAQVSVAQGNGFGGGVIYYPTDTSQGTFGAIAIAPGYGTTWSWYGWLGPRLASFGFVVIGIETNDLNEWADARGAELLAALDWLVKSSPVRDRVDPTRLAVAGHSMGGGGALLAATQRPSLMTAIGMAPYVPNGNLSELKIPTVLFGGQVDTTVSPSYLASAYATLPASTQRAYVEIAGEGHGFAAGGGGGNSGAFARTMMIWMKSFIDLDTRYTPFLCPSLANSGGISKYEASCPLVPSGATPTTSPTTVPPASGACGATYRTVNSWQGGYQGEVTVTAGGSAISGWTVRWVLSSGQTITQVWNGTLSTSGENVSVRNASYNGSLQPSASTTFGFLGSGSASTPTLTCTSS